MTWALLQERISATGYGPENEIYRGSLVINTVQSFLAMIVGYIYMTYKERRKNTKNEKNTPKNTKEEINKKSESVFVGNMQLFKELVLVAVSQSLASPFGYASLQYVNYLTLLLAKSCKLVPVMFIHLTVYRRKFPLYKYLVVLSITMGVFMFTYYKSSSSSKSAAVTEAASGPASWIGLGLLGINLLLDGVTNSTQDHIFHKHKQMTGPHMMFGLNGVATLLTSLYLLISAVIIYTLTTSTTTTTSSSSSSSSSIVQTIEHYITLLCSNQLQTTISFVSRNGPRVLIDIILFGLCGGLGQVFIFKTLETYGSLILVTVTVTRKMFSMLLSVVWFNHTLTIGQWVGVAAVFGGIGVEALFKYNQQKQKEENKKKS